MLIGATCINIGEYTKALKSYSLSEKEIPELYGEPEMNLKLSAIYLNIGICYIYLNNFTISEKYLKKGLFQIEGLLGNDIIYRVYFLVNVA